jgi:hypothetical protein
MVIEYKKSYMRSHLIFGLFWVLFFLLFTFFSDTSFLWFDFGYLAIAAMYLGMYIYQKRYGYLTLEKGVLKLNDPRNKYIDLNTVTRFKFFAGDYILESDSKKLKVNTALMEPPSVVQLKTELEKYGLIRGTSRNLQTKSN